MSHETQRAERMDEGRKTKNGVGARAFDALARLMLAALIASPAAAANPNRRTHRLPAESAPTSATC